MITTDLSTLVLFLAGSSFIAYVLGQHASRNLNHHSDGTASLSGTSEQNRPEQEFRPMDKYRGPWD